MKIVFKSQILLSVFAICFAAAPVGPLDWTAQGGNKITKTQGQKVDRQAQKGGEPKKRCAAILFVTEPVKPPSDIRNWVLNHSRGITTPLMKAAALGDYGEADRLINSGSDVNETNESGCTALTWAAMSQNENLVDRLIQGGADVNRPDSMGLTALMVASSAPSIGIVSALIDAGADVNAAQTGQTSAKGFTSLMYAAANDRPRIVKYLLDSGASIGATELLGRTALAVAASRASVPLITVLIEAGANVNAASPKGEYSTANLTPLHYAAAYNQPDVVKYLLEAGADPNITDVNGRGALLFTITPRQVLNPDPKIPVSIAKALVEAGANINAVSTGPRSPRAKRKIGFTPLIAAADFGQIDLVEYLLSVGADSEIKSAKGQTAYDVAIEQNHSDIADLLTRR
ncbi:MAG: hypothetical protein GY789_12085 [Hyphomicrobiales bacterium]|nr:hypothetical protein [Hyphomicrobiales bacterium]